MAGKDRFSEFTSCNIDCSFIGCSSHPGILACMENLLYTPVHTLVLDHVRLQPGLHCYIENSLPTRMLIKAIDLKFFTCI